MEDSRNDLALAFRNRIATQTVLIERSYRDSNGAILTEFGTGVIIGHGLTEANKYLKIATAGHLIVDSPDKTIQWRVTRTEKEVNGQLRWFVRQFTTSRPIASEPRFISPCDYHECDIGCIAIDNACDACSRTLTSSHPFLDTEKHKPLSLSPRTGYLQPGARVAWAGFPALAHAITGAYQLCYFEGVVSAAPSRLPLYLIDGHVAEGVSGGPLWFCKPDGVPVVIGVVCNYSVRKESPMPGLTAFTPLHVLLDFIEQMADPNGASTELGTDHRDHR
jgi:hypothetical protein